MVKSLGLILENTREEVKGNVNMIFRKAGIPAYLAEGIILDVLSDIREAKTQELINEYEKELQAMNEAQKKEEKEADDKENQTEEVKG